MTNERAARGPVSESQQGQVELDTSLTSLGWLQNMSIGAGPSGFGGQKIVGHQVERRKQYRSAPTGARPPQPKSAPTQKSASASKPSQRPKSAPNVGNKTQQSTTPLYNNVPNNSSSNQNRATPQPQPRSSGMEAAGAPAANIQVPVVSGASATGVAQLAAGSAESTCPNSVRVPPHGKAEKEVHARPPYTYAVLVHMALNDLKGNSGTLAEVCEWMILQYPFFEKKSGNSNWAEVIKSNLKSIGHATYSSETDKWTLLAEYGELYRSPSFMKKRGPKPPRKQGKLRSPSLNSLDTASVPDLRFSSAGNLQVSKSQTVLVPPKQLKQPKAKRMKRSNSVSYQAVTRAPKDPAFQNSQSVIADIFTRNESQSDSPGFDWESMIKLNVSDIPAASELLTSTTDMLSDMIKSEQCGVFDEFPSALTDIEMELGITDSRISGTLNSTGGDTNNLSLTDPPYDNLMDTNLLTADWTVAF